MAHIDPCALKIARLITEAEIPAKSPAHAALIETQLHSEARTIERITAIAGLSLAELERRVDAARLTVLAVLDDREEALATRAQHD
jgi:hypothetical protein